MTDSIPLYLDCDTGVDDAVAIAYLLASTRVDLVGIGTVSGNTSAHQAARNTLDLLAIAGRADVPVAVGAHDHLAHAYRGGAAHVHGDNGIGGVVLPRSPRDPDAASAVELLVALSHRYAGALRILAIGPLTNIALALAADPTLPDRVATVTVMGGAARAPGNIGPVSEANVHNDPEAAHAVLAAGWDVTLVPLDVTMEHTLSDTDRLALSEGPPVARVLAEALDVYLEYYRPVYGERRCALHDPLAAVVAVDAVTPTVAPRVPVAVDIGDGPGRGQTIVDLRGQRAGPRDHDGVRTRVVLAIDADVAAHLVETILRG